MYGGDGVMKMVAIEVAGLQAILVMYRCNRGCGMGKRVGNVEF